MKRLVWCVVALVVWGVVAYVCYKQFSSEKAAYIVGAVGAAATIATLFAALPSENKAPTEKIRTEGDFSPGSVGNDYVVNSSTPNTRAKPGAKTDVTPPESVHTQGNYSPGVVGGDYSVSTSHEDGGQHGSKGTRKHG